MSEIVNSFLENYRGGGLFTPHRSITDPRKQRQTRTLIFVLFLTLVINISALFLYVLFTGKFETPGLVTLVIIAIAYGFSRSKSPERGSEILIFSLIVVNYITMDWNNLNITASTIMFLLVPVLLSALLLSGVLTAIVAVLSIGAILLPALVIADVQFASLIRPVLAMGFVSLLVIITAFVRERDIASLDEQTLEVEQFSENLQEEVQRATAISQMGRTLTGTRDLDTLLKEVVRLITETFDDFYHAQVFLLDESRQFAVLRESTGEAGQKLLERQHRLAVGSQSVIGEVTSRNVAVIASDTDTDAVHRRNILLPLTRAEMALPLQIGGRVIGALDIQSQLPNAFSQTEISMFQTMADQLAIAIENARLFIRAQQDLADIERLNKQLTGEAWASYVSEKKGKKPIGYAADDMGIRPLLTGASGAEETDGDEEKVSIPLTIRGQEIGSIDVSPKEKSAEPDEATQQMLEAIAERVSMALDSTRLADESQRQVFYDQILGEVSTALQTTTDLDTILSTVAREVSRAMKSPKGYVHLSLQDSSEQ